MSKMIYVAGPYTAADKTDMLLNVHRAMAVAAALIVNGWVAICPHLSHYLAPHLPNDVGFTHTLWMGQDLPILSKCDAVYFLRGWERSRGAQIEHQFVQEQGAIEIIYEETIHATQCRPEDPRP